MISFSQSSNNDVSNAKGVVDDDYGESVIGASVVIKGTSRGTITDSEGNFSIATPQGSTLIVSFIGYIPQEVKYTGQSLIRVRLQEDTHALGEVVVTALGMTRDKKALGYAITELKGEDIARVNSASPLTGLQGKVAGVQINMGNSGPQSSQRILIRGNSSLGSNNQPIFVIDGIIIDNEVTKTGQGQDFGNDLKNLNPDDFETLSVLKGAAATALYGSRAANGVILISTKKGRKGEGIGVSVSHAQTFDNVYGFPKLQNTYGMGTQPAWNLNADGTEDRNISAGRNFGPKFDGLAYQVDGVDLNYSAKKDNIKQMYQTGHYMNTNAAIQGGDDKGSFRFSYSNLASQGTTVNNEFGRNSFSLTAQRDISKRLKAESGFSFIQSSTKNPTYQGGEKSPIYDFMFSVPREYDTSYWLKNYKSRKGDGWNEEDPFSYSKTLWEYYENEYIQDENNFRAYLNLDFKILDWLSFKMKGDMYKIYKTREAKVLATGKSNYDGSKYEILETKKEQYKITAMLSAFHSINDFSIVGSMAAEQWDTRSGYHESYSTNGLRIPGQFDISNSVSPPRTKVRYNTDRKRINSVYAFANMDYKSQYYLDVTGRNDWSSALIYADGRGNTSYFYPSVSASWLFTETFKKSIPSIISFGKIRASYAIVGNDCDPYLTTSTGYYEFDNTFVNPSDGRDYPYYKFDSDALPNLNLKPEKQHSIELGLDLRLLSNRLNFDFAWYKTNTKNQILALQTSSETGVNTRWINSGNIENSGLELLITAIPIQTKDWQWMLTLNYTRNRNKIIELAPGVERYRLAGGGSETEAYATVGGSYGDIYTTKAYSRNEKGEKILDKYGSWVSSGTSEKVGSLQPDFLGGFVSTVSYKGLTVNAVLDARFGGDIFSGSYNYGTSSGTLAHTLYGRDKENGGLARTLSDGRILYDGMIPEGVFGPGLDIKGQDVSGMTYQQAYEQGIVEALSAYKYYGNLTDWGNGIREESIMKSSWVAMREISVSWAIPKKWANKFQTQNINVGIAARNLGYLYNSLPDNIHPEGLNTIQSSEYYESGGAAYTRNFGFNINATF
ncbi:SusC/RagA family TonB-linked outer membrane protein [Bacteroidales bacterium]|nr:SusC/RagA family TonB-linked outer membrane protein [Bacteroidales bacterium]